MRYIWRVVYIAVFICSLFAVAAGTAMAQYKGIPVKKDKLLGVLRSHQLQTREIVGVIKTNGVDFQVDERVEGELTGAGARPEVIAAAKAHYRGATAAVVNKPAVPVTNSGPANPGVSAAPTKFSGKPLDKAGIINLLENGMAEAQIVKNIQTRGVNYYQSSKDQQDIRTAGGSQALVNLIGGSYAGGDSAPQNTGNAGNAAVAPVAEEEDDFGDLTANPTAESLQRVIDRKTDKPLPYQQLGIWYLYKAFNIIESEKYFREAISRGGSGVFVVAHDHGSGMFTTGCVGNLYIAKDTIRFESHDNIHTFETPITSVEKAKMNSSFASAFKAMKGSFSIKLRTGEKDSKNYNFAPASQNENESKMLLRLVGKN